jgi:hypothetical protein
MSLILAIEPDQRQAAQLADLVRGRLNADLVHAHTTEGALTALAGIGDRVPDLVLVPSLLSAQEDAEIAGALRVIAAAANVRMLTIPMLADPEQPPQHRGVFAKLRGRKPQTTPGGCDPAVFAEQIASYLAEAAAERRAAQEADADLVSPEADDLKAAAAAPIAAPSDHDLPPTEERVGEEHPSPVLEPTPIRYAPLVIGPAPPPLRAIEEHVSVVLDDEDTLIGDLPLVLPGAPEASNAAQHASSSWLTTPAAPIADPQSEDEESDLIAIAAQAALTVDETRAHEALATQEASPVVVDEPAASAVIDEEGNLALEEVLQALVREEAAQETIVALPSAREDGPVVVAIPESPDDIELVAVPAPVEERAPLVSRRRRKAARKASPETDDRFDLDELLAPLLSEIAAKRAAPEKPGKPEKIAHALVVPPVEDTPQISTAGEIREIIPSPVEVAVEPLAAAPAPPVTDNDVSTPIEPMAVEPALEELAEVALVAAPTAVTAIVVEELPVVPSQDEPVVPKVAAAAEIDVDPMFFADDVHDGRPDPAPLDRPAWVQLIESLRKDIERLKTERTPPAHVSPAASAPEPIAPIESAVPPRIGRVLSIAAARPASHVPVTPAAKLHALTPRVRAPKPIQDQWGLFDPEQCGFAALRAKLDEISAREDVSV